MAGGLCPRAAVPRALFCWDPGAFWSRLWSRMQPLRSVQGRGVGAAPASALIRESMEPVSEASSCCGASSPRSVASRNPGGGRNCVRLPITAVPLPWSGGSSWRGPCGSPHPLLLLSRRPLSPHFDRCVGAPKRCRLSHSSAAVLAFLAVELCSRRGKEKAR